MFCFEGIFVLFFGFGGGRRKKRKKKVCCVFGRGVGKDRGGVLYCTVLYRVWCFCS